MARRAPADPFGFQRAINWSAIDKLNDEDLARILQAEVNDNEIEEI
jgi:hypothetical protein